MQAVRHVKKAVVIFDDGQRRGFAGGARPPLAPASNRQLSAGHRCAHSSWWTVIRLEKQGSALHLDLQPSYFPVPGRYLRLLDKEFAAFVQVSPNPSPTSRCGSGDPRFRAILFCLCPARSFLPSRGIPGLRARRPEAGVRSVPGTLAIGTSLAREGRGCRKTVN